jgi:hypothetical protein
MLPEKIEIWEDLEVKVKMYILNLGLASKHRELAE